MGDYVAGRNIFTVDVTNQNDQTWFDIVGVFHSDALHVTGASRLSTPIRSSKRSCLTDLKVYTRPWKLPLRFSAQGLSELWERRATRTTRTR